MARRKYYIEPGAVYGRLTVIEEVHDYYRRGEFWLCVCECGIHRTVEGKMLGNGGTKSCGCLSQEISTRNSTKHGYCGTRLYRIWQNMRTRCTRTVGDDYKHYGGRGIRYHPDFETFEGFLAGIPEGYADHLELDRIDNDGDYTPGNLRWATRREQMRHTRITGRIPHPRTGELRTWGEIAEEFELPERVLYSRVVLYGLDMDRAIAKEYIERTRLSREKVAAIKSDLWSMSMTDVSIYHDVSMYLIRRIRDGAIYRDVDY